MRIRAPPYCQLVVSVHRPARHCPTGNAVVPGRPPQASNGPPSTIRLSGNHCRHKTTVSIVKLCRDEECTVCASDDDSNPTNGPVRAEGGATEALIA